MFVLGSFILTWVNYPSHLSLCICVVVWILCLLKGAVWIQFYSYPVGKNVLRCQFGLVLGIYVSDSTTKSVYSCPVAVDTSYLCIKIGCFMSAI